MLKQAFQGEAIEFEFVAAGDEVDSWTIAASFVPVKDSHEVVLKLIGTTKDMTDYTRTADALKVTKEYAENLINSSLDIIVSVDAKGRIMEFNPAAELAFGYTKDEVLGQPADLLYGNPIEAQPIRKCITQTGRFAGEVTNKQRDGRLFETYLSASVIRDSHGHIIGVMGISRDITERKALEAQLAQAQKLEAIGQLAAGIGHEINTPIQFVGDNLRFLQEAFQDLQTLVTCYAEFVKTYQAGTATAAALSELEATANAADLTFLTDEIPTAIMQSLDGITRVAEIVRAMKEFSHPGSNKKTVIDLNRAIESTITVARNEWKYVADMVTDFDPTLPLVPCFPGEFNQVVLNMVVNAAHAIDTASSHDRTKKGTITIRTRLDDVWAEVSIADTGTGMPLAIRDKIFEPFFTTKEVGKGTGQGLAIAYDVVVKKHGGTISFETEEEHGTTFLIRLPLKAPMGSENTAC